MATIKEQARTAGAARVLIEAHVDRRNLGSKRMNEAAGFVFDSRDGDDWEVWLYYEEL